jgi:hypothetical protein
MQLDSPPWRSPLTRIQSFGTDMVSTFSMFLTRITVATLSTNVSKIPNAADVSAAGTKIESVALSESRTIDRTFSVRILLSALM